MHAERNATVARFRRKLRLECIAAYGSACACCGETGERFLAIDHTNGDGAVHRRGLRGGRPQAGAGNAFYPWLRANGFPRGFQILCWNCNWAKRFGSCPHEVNLKEMVNAFA